MPAIARVIWAKPAMGRLTGFTTTVYSNLCLRRHKAGALSPGLPPPLDAGLDPASWPAARLWPGRPAASSGYVEAVRGSEDGQGGVTCELVDQIR